MRVEPFNLDPVSDLRAVRENLAAVAIWEAQGGILPLFHEIVRRGSELEEQQNLCRKQAKAVVDALFGSIPNRMERAG